ncbi:hypothetical protein [Burkholderia anthina]|uniref:hypothetical protein n=1 Tax=Burkholderia anthina TaxID=179879 RepID=UPI00158CD245|nr:hypothetical protein [Burkholderia anthina]
MRVPDVLQGRAMTTSWRVGTLNPRLRLSRPIRFTRSDAFQAFADEQKNKTARSNASHRPMSHAAFLRRYDLIRRNTGRPAPQAARPSSARIASRRRTRRRQEAENAPGKCDGPPHSAHADSRPRPLHHHDARRARHRAEQ